MSTSADATVAGDGSVPGSDAGGGMCSFPDDYSASFAPLLFRFSTNGSWGAGQTRQDLNMPAFGGTYSLNGATITIFDSAMGGGCDPTDAGVYTLA